MRWVFVAVCGLSLVVASGGYSSLWCTDFSLWWLLLLWSTGSRCVGFSSYSLRALEHRLSSCGAQALLLRGIWDLPGGGIESMSPALAGGFLTTVPPGKSLFIILYIQRPKSLASLGKQVILFQRKAASGYWFVFNLAIDMFLESKVLS